MGALGTLTEEVADDGSEIRTHKRGGLDGLETIKRRFVGRRPVNMEDFKDKSTNIIITPVPIKPLDYSNPSHAAPR